VAPSRRPQNLVLTLALNLPSGAFASHLSFQASKSRKCSPSSPQPPWVSSWLPRSSSPQAWPRSPASPGLRDGQGPRGSLESQGPRGSRDGQGSPGSRGSPGLRASRDGRGSPGSRGSPGRRGSRDGRGSPGSRGSPGRRASPDGRRSPESHGWLGPRGSRDGRGSPGSRALPGSLQSTASPHCPGRDQLSTSTSRLRAALGPRGSDESPLGRQEQPTPPDTTRRPRD